jgi:polyhydroxybutyrate depolymerase
MRKIQRGGEKQMTLKKYCVLALVVIMAMLLALGGVIPVAADPTSEGPSDSSPGLHIGWMTELSAYNVTYNRTFEYYIPDSYTGSEEVPLLFSFHGLGSSGEEQRDLTRFDLLAEQEGFIAVFPDATVLDPDDYPEAELPPLTGANIQWNLGAGSLQYYAGIDDVGFVEDMLSWFETYYNINTGEIYSTGMSDGALFSYLLAFSLPDAFAAIAPVCGPMPWGFGNLTAPPTTVIEIHGTTDPILSYYGYGGLGGNVTLSVDETINYWRGIDNISTDPVQKAWGTTPTDSTTVTRYVYSGGDEGTRVVLLKISGGGHTWPGGPQYLDVTVVGRVTTHVDGSAQIWKYLPPLKYCLTLYSSLGGSASTPGRETFANVLSAGDTMFFDAGISPTTIDLVATPVNDDFEFVNWTGDVSTIADVNAATTTVTVQPNTDYEITANFKVASVTPPPSGGCFIATAAYGTSTAKQLDVLRAFRDEVLLRSAIGSRLVDIYYRTSPPIAEFISRHEVLRTLVRELLIDPIVWVAQATENMWQS